MKKNRNDVAVGSFVVLGFILLTLIVFFVSGVYFFRSGYALHVMYDYVSILDKGAPVRLAGVRVGEVSRVDLTEDEESGRTRVRVKLFIEKEVEIRENYLLGIQGTHILSEPHIEITPVPGDFPLLRDEDTVEGITPVAVEDLIGHANQIAAELKGILSKIHRALKDEDVGPALKEIVLHMAKLTRSLNTVISGSEGELMALIENIQSSTHTLKVILDRVDEGRGTLGKLLSEDELYEEIRDFVREIKTHPWKLLKKK